MWRQALPYHIRESEKNGELGSRGTSCLCNQGTAKHSAALCQHIPQQLCALVWFSMQLQIPLTILAAVLSGCRVGSLFFQPVCSQGVGSYVHSLFEHQTMVQAVHSLRSPCSHAPFGRAATARVSSPRDWAVAIKLAHAAERGQFSSASTSWNTTCLALDCSVRPAETRISKMSINSLSGSVVILGSHVLRRQYGFRFSFGAVLPFSSPFGWWSIVALGRRVCVRVAFQTTASFRVGPWRSPSTL